MPRFGTINERRHQLHEVIRLSGMNMIVNDVDQPLIIKVASLPNERMQVYFIDNEDYFKRKALYEDKKSGEFFEDNDERAIFFTKGILETVKKLNWKPDVIHVQGWMSSFLPLYLRKYYGDDAFFSEVKIVYSIFDKPFEGKLSEQIMEKVSFDIEDTNEYKHLEDPTFVNLLKVGIDHSDVIIQGDEVISEELSQYVEEKKKPFKPFQSLEEVTQVYTELFNEDED